MLGVGIVEELEDWIIEAYYNMREEDGKRADLILAGIKSFVFEIFMKRA